MRLVMPAIYHLEGGQDQSRHGWHRLGDLVMAVNNLFVERGVLCRYLAWDPVSRYWKLAAGLRLDWIENGEVQTATDPQCIRCQ